MNYPTSHTIFRIPPSHHHCHLGNYQADARLSGIIRDFIADQRRHLLLTGNPGTGKTHLSVALYRWAVSQFGTQQVFWCEFPQFAIDVKRSYSDGGDPLQDVAEATEFVALDDVFGRDLTPHEYESILYPCIQMAYRNQARLVFTTNFSVEQISEKLTTHELDRLLESCFHYSFEGPSQRK